MKQLLLIFISALTLSLSAQEKTTKKEVLKTEIKSDNAEAMAKTEAKKLTQQLGLSSEQGERVYAAFLNHYKEELNKKENSKPKIRIKGAPQKEDMNRKISIEKNVKNEKLNAQLRGILTPEQYDNYIKNN